MAFKLQDKRDATLFRFPDDASKEQAAVEYDVETKSTYVLLASGGGALDAFELINMLHIGLAR